MKYWIRSDNDGTPRALYRLDGADFEYWDKRTHAWTNCQSSIGLVLHGDVDMDPCTEAEATALTMRWRQAG